MQRNLLRQPKSLRFRRNSSCAQASKTFRHTPNRRCFQALGDATLFPSPKKIAIASGSRFRASPAARREHSLRAVRTRWWTGEDSNLRSPQGAADLQSAGFSHSPTRPHGGNFKQRRPQYMREVCKDTKTLPHLLRDAGTCLPQINWDFPLTRKILAELAEGFEPPTL